MTFDSHHRSHTRTQKKEIFSRWRLFLTARLTQYRRRHRKNKHFSDHVHSHDSIISPATQQWASVGETKRGRATPQQRHPSTKSRPQGGSPRGQAGITHTHKMAGNYRCVCVCWCRRIDQCHRVTLWVMMMMSLLCLHTHTHNQTDRGESTCFSRRNLFVCV